MKKILYIMLIAVIAALPMQAQETAGDKKATVEAVIVAYVTQKLSLTADEANSFMPIFKNYMKEYRTASSGTEEDVIKKNEAVVQVQKKFKPQFKTVLKIDKRVNEAFNVHKSLVNRLKNRAAKARPARRGK